MFFNKFRPFLNKSMKEELTSEVIYNPRMLGAYKCLIAANFSQTSKLKLIPKEGSSFQLRIGAALLSDPLAAALAIGNDAVVPR